MVAGDGFALVADSSQAAWRTVDGISWERMQPGVPPDHSATTLVREMLLHRDTFVAAGEGGIYFGDPAGGDVWQRAVLGTGDASDLMVNHIESDGAWVMAVVRRSLSPPPNHALEEL